MLSAEALRSILTYDPETGIFTRKLSHPRAPQRIGEIAGGIVGNGYRWIAINKKQYSAHRLAWLYVYGEFPAGGLDHKNGDRDDNRIANLREATCSQNLANRKTRSISGLKGVSREHRTGKWVAQITKDRKPKHLGTFSTPEAAHAAYCKAALELHGEFSRF